MSNRSSYRGSAAVALLAWCIAAPYATLASAAAAPTYYGTGISVRYHNGLGLDLHHPPQIPVGTRLNLGCSIKASGRSNPGWSIAIYANGHPLLVRPSTASDITLSRGGVYSIGVSNWKVRRGRNTVSCHLAINGSNSELMAPGLVFNTIPRTKACKGALTADVELQPDQLGTPAWKAAGVQTPHVVLPLQSSASAGNAVTCIYSSVHGDVTVTTSLQCNNAHKQGGQNTYSCE